MIIYEILRVKCPELCKLICQKFGVEIKAQNKADPGWVDWKREMVTDSDGRYLGYSSRAMKL